MRPGPRRGILFITMQKTDWYGCYKDSWKEVLIDEAFVHPAKFSRSLIRRIYKHAIAEGWLRADNCVIDPFGGVAAGALDAMRLKINWVGVEIERHFFDIANGVDCTGITKADWIRFHKRPDKARYLDGRHWCPRCVAEIARVENGSSNLDLFDLPDSAAYVRNSGKTPSVAPHHYVGNIEAWKAKTNFAGAKMLNGDSRRLREVLWEEAACCVSSPPFSPVGNQVSGGWQGVRQDYKDGKRKSARPDSTYGDHPAQLGAMREGEFSAGQLGVESGETFWSAARQIVEETYAVLKPGGHAIWICKDYVKKGKRVPFCKQWMQICESVGFKILHWHHAWLIEDYGMQYDLLGEHKTNFRERKGFFRRLAEKKGSPRIDFEVILCMEK